MNDNKRKASHHLSGCSVKIALSASSNRNKEESYERASSSVGLKRRGRGCPSGIARPRVEEGKGREGAS